MNGCGGPLSVAAFSVDEGRATHVRRRITPAASRAAAPVASRSPRALRLDVRVRARVVAP